MEYYPTIKWNKLQTHNHMEGCQTQTLSTRGDSTYKILGMSRLYFHE